MRGGFHLSLTIQHYKPCRLRARAPGRQGQTHVSQCHREVRRHRSLCSPFLLATPAAAQRVVQRYEAYPQQRSSGNHGGGFLEFLFSGGQPSPAGYRALYPQSGSMRYNDPSYRQAAYGPAGALDAPVQRGMNPIYLRQEASMTAGNGRARSSSIRRTSSSTSCSRRGARFATGSALAVRLHVVRRQAGLAQGGMAGLDATA